MDYSGLAGKLHNLQARLKRQETKWDVTAPATVIGSTLYGIREAYRALKKRTIALEKTLRIDTPEIDLEGEGLRDLRWKIRSLRSRIVAVEQFKYPPLRPVGIGPYLCLGEPGGLAKWVEISAQHGAGVVRVIPLGYTWLPGLRPLFMKAGNRFDLGRLDPDTVKDLRDGLKLAQALGVVVMIDLFDEVSLEDGERRARHPFNSINNIHPDAPTDGLAWTTWDGIDDTDSRRVRSLKQQIEHCLKGDWPGDDLKTFQLRLREYVRMIVDICEGYEDTVILFVGNETESREVDYNVLHWLVEFGWLGDLGISSTYLYSDEPVADLHGDKLKQWIFQTIDVFRMHHVRWDTVDHLMDRARDIAAPYDNLAFIADSDGAGSGSIRGERNRPTYEQEQVAAQAALDRGAIYWMSKILGDEDSVAMLETLERVIC